MSTPNNSDQSFNTVLELIKDEFPNAYVKFDTVINTQIIVIPYDFVIPMDSKSQDDLNLPDSEVNDLYMGE